MTLIIADYSLLYNNIVIDLYFPAQVYLLILVEHRGLEPLTPTLPVWCAPGCANAPCEAYCNRYALKLQYVFLFNLEYLALQNQSVLISFR